MFRLNTNGAGFTILRTFVATNYVTPEDGPGEEPAYTNVDGALPASVMASGSTLYGTTYLGGTNGTGTVFALTTNGSEFAILHHFPATTGVNATNTDGANPFAGLTLSDGTLFGTATAGGNTGNGTIFSLTTAPRLNITRVNSSVTLTWPTTAVGFALESNTNLTAPLGWVAATPAPTLVNGLKTVTNAITATPKFYRLKH